MPSMSDPRYRRAMRAALDGHDWGNTFVKDRLDAAERGGLGKTVCYGCRQGHCCRQPVMCTWVDALPAAAWLHESGQCTEPEISAMREIGRAHEAALIAGDNDTRTFDCMFYTPLERSSCKIYEVRPMVCRTYFVFKTRENCVPYGERPDGRRPTICALDYGDAVEAALLACSKLSHSLGHPEERDAWMRSLPMLVAILLESFTLSEEAMWEHILRESRLPWSTLAAMVDKQVELNPGAVAGVD